MFSSYKSYETGYGHTVQEFGGLNEGRRISEKEFAKMMNMSLQEYPLLTVRDKRLTLSEKSDDEWCVSLWHRGSFLKIVNEGIGEPVLYIDGMRYRSVKLNNEMPKSIIGMGAYALILPDKVYVNTAASRMNIGIVDRIQWGYVDAICMGSATFEPCTLSGEVYSAKTISKVAPSSPANGDVWVDTSEKQSAYKVWDESLKQWTGVGTTYVKIKIPYTDNTKSGSFAKWDAAGITPVNLTIYELSGAEMAAELAEKITEQLGQFASLTSDTASILFDVTDTGSVLEVIVAGIIDRPFSMETAIRRTMPGADFLFEHNNRLWGCCFSKPWAMIFPGKNEIVASRQGDLTNWRAYLGISGDSYAATVGAPGEFTGGVSYGGYPIFFKEDYIIKVYGDTPASYQIVTIPGMGVEKGMHESLVVSGNVLFYKSPSCFCAYDGSSPVNISSKLKNRKYKSIKAGATDDRVFFACEEQDGERYMLVFEIKTGAWTKENCGNISGFIRQGASLNFTENDDEGYITAIRSVDENYDEDLLKKAAEGEEQLYPKAEEKVCWYCESGDMGIEVDKLSYITKVTVKVRLSAGAQLKALISCDGKKFRQVGDKVVTPGLVTVGIPIAPERCESFRYRLEGKGYVEIYGISYELKEGSDKK